MSLPTLLKTKDASTRLGISKSTLEKLRLTGSGPVFVKRGKSVFYTEQDLTEWIQANRRRSTSDTGEQVMFILYGKGANGKSVFLRTIGALLGDYCMTTPPETLMTRRNSGGPSPDLARLP